ncbi:MAG: hypothetical protein JRN59_07155 [Nitrososphaerota archaeon]|nr:hypothetical protein [Nitrososphaerota archaeon]
MSGAQTGWTILALTLSPALFMSLVSLLPSPAFSEETPVEGSCPVSTSTAKCIFR